MKRSPLFLPLLLGVALTTSLGCDDDPDPANASAAAGSAGGSDAGPGGSGGAAAGSAASGGQAGAPPVDCSQITGSQTGSALSDRVAAIFDGLTQQGWNFTTGGDVGGDQIFVHGIEDDAPLPESPSPELAALDLVSQLPNSPFVVAEYEIAETKSSFASKTVTFARRLVGGTETRFWRPGLVVHVEEGGDGVWRLLSFSFYASVALATQAEIDQLAACTSDAPPDTAPIYDSSFEGNLFDNCAPIGMYQYQPSRGDTIEWQDPVAWLGSIGDGEVVEWKIFRPAHLVISPANYWDDIAYADCICHDEAGFTLTVDWVTGEPLSYSPGVNCVVC